MIPKNGWIKNSADAKIHYVNDVWHNDNGPAAIYCNGTKEWYINGRLHREDGPAYESYDGHKEWYQHNYLHREDGPAIECISGDKEWWYKGNKIDCHSNQEFFKLIKLLAFL